MKFRQDKVLHFIAGVLIVQAAFTVCSFVGLCARHSFAVAIPVSVLVTAGKEVLWDRLLGRGVPSVDDFVAGVVGTACGFLLQALAIVSL